MGALASSSASRVCTCSCSRPLDLLLMYSAATAASAATVHPAEEDGTGTGLLGFDCKQAYLSRLGWLADCIHRRCCRAVRASAAANGREIFASHGRNCSAQSVWENYRGGGVPVRYQLYR